MKTSFRNLLVCALVLCLFTACNSSTDKPTVPQDAPEGMDSFYDFSFSERYDDNIMGDFSLVLSEEVNPIPDTLFLFAKYKNESVATKEYTYNGDGMVPYTYNRHWYSGETGGLMVGTDYYEPDHAEYISYLWSDQDGVKTSENVAVGSTEKELLAAYTNHLYYISRDEALSEAELSVISIIGYDDGNAERLDEAYDFDYAYMWQPFTTENNDRRDITFYISGGKVAAIEMINPFELRHVYGYDRDAGLQYTEKQRKEGRETV